MGGYLPEADIINLRKLIYEKAAFAAQVNAKLQ